MKNLSFKMKTYLSFGVIIILVVTSIGISFYSLNNLTKQYDHTIQGVIKTRDVLREVSVGMLMSRRHEKDFLLRKKEKYIKKHHKETKLMLSKLDKNKAGIVDISDEKSFVKARQSIVNYQNGFNKVIIGYQKEGNSKTGLRGEMRSTAHRLEKLINEEPNKDKLNVHFLTLRRREKDYLLRRDNKYLAKAQKDTVAFNTDLSKSPNKDKINTELNSYIALFKKVTINYDDIKNTISSFRKDIHTFEKIDKKDIELINIDIVKRISNLHNLRDNVELILTGIGAFILLVSISICIYFARVSNRIFDLTNRLKISSDKTNLSSENVKRAASDVSSSTTQQASAIQETVSSLDEIKSMVEKSVSNATESTDSAQNSVQIANQGKGKVGEMITAIGDIKDTNQEIIDQMDQNNKQLETIVNIIREISNKTNVINDIVFQTKLLSFNASVEAARAGEHGKGFAVVAEEVGNLANMSGTASKEIEDMLSDSINKVNSIFQDTKSSVEKLIKEADLKTEQGVKVANECNNTLEDIVAGANTVKSMLNEINEAQREQSAGVSNIAEAMNELDQTTHQNSNIANETSGFSNELAEQAQELQDIVNALENEIAGGAQIATGPSFSDSELSELDNEFSEEPNVTHIETKKATEVKAQLASANTTVQAKSISQEIPTADDSRFEEI